MADWVATSWYERFKDFQSLLGFGGVILTLWWNAKLKRDEHERIIAHERKTLVAALRAELWANKQLHFRTLQQMEAENAKLAYFIMNPARDVFASATSKVGLLKPLQASGIIHAYSNLAIVPQALKETVSLLRTVRGDSTKLEMNGDLLTIRATDFEVAIPVIKSTIEALEKEIEALTGS